MGVQPLSEKPAAPPVPVEVDYLRCAVNRRSDPSDGAVMVFDAVVVAGG